MVEPTTPASPPDRLQGLHPELSKRLQRVLAAMEALGFPMRVTDGLRTTAEQQALYAKGRTAPGRIVTQVDGVVVKSNHQVQADGFGHAADCCFRGPTPYPEDDTLWAAYGALGEALGLVWGGRWITLKDRPHLQWRHA